jgi:hypothetical protein
VAAVKVKSSPSGVDEGFSRIEFIIIIIEKRLFDDLALRSGATAASKLCL